MTRLHLQIPFVLCAWLCLLPSVHATDFYVDRNHGDNQTGNGSKSAPWRNITVALDPEFNPNLSAGDTIHVASGTYDDTPDVDGLFEKFPLDLSVGVSLIGAGSDRVIVDAKGSPAPVIFASALLVIRRLDSGRHYAETVRWYRRNLYRGIRVDVEGMTLRHTNNTGVGVQFIQDVTATIRDCRIVGHSMAIDSRVPVTVTGCTIAQKPQIRSLPPSRAHYRPYDPQSTHPVSVKFRERYKQASRDGENWVEDPLLVVQRAMSLRYKSEYRPDRLSVFYPNWRDEEEFVAQAQGDGAHWVGDRVSVVILHDPIVDDDSVRGKEVRIDLERKDGRWEMVWAGFRSRCSRGSTFGGWTTDLCP